MNFRFFFIVMLLAATVGLSWYASEPLYRFYLQVWYGEVKNITPETMEKEASRLYDRHEYEKLARYLERLVVVYRSDSTIIRKAGLYYIRMKQRERGAELVAEAVGEKNVPLAEVRSAVSVLFHEGYYGDVEGILKHKRPLGDPDLQYYYGVSLYKKGRAKEGAAMLKRAYRNGYQDTRSLLYLGRAMSGAGNLDEAEAYLEMAWHKESYNHEIRKALADVYRKQGKLEKAAGIIIRKK